MFSFVFSASYISYVFIIYVGFINCFFAECATLSDFNKSNVLISEIVQPVDWWLAAYHSGLIPNPYWDANDVLLRNFSYQSQELCYNFTVPRNYRSGSAIELKVDGVGALSTLFLNGQLIGKTENEFRSYTFNVNPFLKQATTNQSILIRFQPSPKFAQAQSGEYFANFNYSLPPRCPPDLQNGECHVNFLRTRQSSFGWDGGPSFPTMAITRPIRLVSYSNCMIDHLNILPIQTIDGSNPIIWKLIVEFDTSCDREGNQLKVKFEVPELNISKVQLFVPSIEQYHAKLVLQVPQTGLVNLWWPSGYGNQPLYSGRLSIPGGQTLQRQFGFRTVTLVQDPIKMANRSDGGLTFYFKINGVPIFLKGANWVPPDSFRSRVSCKKIKYYFKQMRKAHFNALRICGVFTYERDCFYDFADHFGILVWQDLMFGNALYPINTAFLENVENELKDQLTRLKGHPSILLWAANNEVETGLAHKWWDKEFNAPKSSYLADYLVLYNETIKPIVDKLDGTRPFLLSTPSNGKKLNYTGPFYGNPDDERYGDTHFYSYDKDPWNITTYPIPRCASEFGYQSLPCRKTWLTALRSDQLQYFNPAVVRRQHHPHGQIEMLQEILMNLPNVPPCAGIANKTDAAICLGLALSFDDLVYLSQLNQAEAVRVQVEHYRRMRSSVLPDGRGKTMCSIYWQLNDIWQAPSWSSIDYSGEWKMLHYFAKRFFAPMLVSLFEDSKTLFAYVVSDQLEPIYNVTLHISVFSWKSFTPLNGYNISIPAIAPLKSRLVWKSKLNNLVANKNGCIAIGWLTKDEKDITSKNVFQNKLSAVGYQDFGSVKILQIRRLRDNLVRIQLVASGIAPFVWISTTDQLNGSFSDNGFAITTPVRIVYFHVNTKSVAGRISEEQFSVKTLENIYKAYL